MGDPLNLHKHEQNDDSQSSRNPVRQKPPNITRRSSSEPSIFFRFPTDTSYAISPAEEIISSGRIIPQRMKPLPRLNKKEKPLSPLCPQAVKEKKTTSSSLRRRSESLPDMQSAVLRTNSAKKSLVGSKSVDCREILRSKSFGASPSRQSEQNSPANNAGRMDWSGKQTRPRWYNLIFRIDKFPQEMKLEDMKHRWLRRSPSTMFPPVNERGEFSVKEKGSWQLLRRGLSCKQRANVHATVPYSAPRV